MINFNDGKEIINNYLGSENKITVVYDGDFYMVKFPDPIIDRKSNLLGYKYNHYSEHIGSSIFKACGFETQETLLGYYTDRTGKKNVVVACKDFTQDGDILYEFAKIANSVTTSYGKQASTIENVNLIIKECPFIENKRFRFKI